MKFSIVECEQRSPAWVLARLGRLCGSRANDMLAQGKGISRRNLRTQLALERVVGRSLEPSFTSRAMQAGIDREPDALALYEVTTGRVLQSTGYLAVDDLLAGCSLDGHVGEFEGIVEGKCPDIATHWEYLRTGTVPLEYARQCLHCLWVTGARWCDWLSYQPDFPASLRLKIVRIHRDDVAIAEYEREVRRFLDEVARECEAIQTMADLSGQLAASVPA